MKAILLAATAALAGAASAASAQGPIWIVDGRATEGELTASDPRPSDEESRYDDYRVQLRGGQRVRISLDSEAFDPIVRIYRDGALDEALAENDDSGESLNSRLAFSPPADGTYVVRVLSFDPDGAGRYSLRGEELAPLPAPITAHNSTASTRWRVFEGELTTADADNDGHHFDDYQVSLRAGEQILVRADSTALDPMVQILPAADRGGSGIEGDDDTGPGTNALLGFEAEEAGDYIVRVSSFGSGETGAYTLRIGGTRRR
ncbi:MAG: hypothetical protein QOI38_820 [Sphingomonadales bacterium]|nr:hypothetical protein [Sphingomonadales bacterium]